MTFPNFFIVGAAKAGTTSMQQYLHEHPDIHMLGIKEPNFFSHEEIKAQNLYYKSEDVTLLEEYQSLFEDQTEPCIGEASVSYLFYQKTAKKIYDYNSGAKIIIILRNPVSRAYSHYQMDKRLGLVNTPFSEIVNAGSGNEENKLHYQQYIELGMYHEQVQRYKEVFPEDQVCILLMEDLISAPEQTMEKVYGFLNVDSSFQINNFEQHNNSRSSKNGLINSLYKSQTLRKGVKAITSNGLRKLIVKVGFNKGKDEQMDPNTKKHLNTLYKNDIVKLASLIDRNLEHWYE
ncbi:MAG: sulfotransferase [Crocinitomicaceae bacterium]|nr:sulfotransferase [Crocinitomicaceae bacterium]